MSLTFLNAFLLPLAGFIAVPILLHLFARTRPPKFLFSSNKLLLGLVRETQRVRKPKDWLILILRVLAVTILVALFLRPVLYLESTLVVNDERRNVVILMDTSASMSAVEGGYTRIATARIEAVQLLKSLRAQDRANLIWIEKYPKAVFPEPGSNLSYLIQKVEECQPVNERGNLKAAVEMAAEMLASMEGTHEIVLISDFQTTNWPEGEMAVGENINLVCIPVSEDVPDNSAIVNVGVEPAMPVVGDAIIVTCEVANYSSASRKNTVYIAIGEARYKEEIRLMPWSAGSVIFTYRPTKDGTYTIHAALDEDSYKWDNERWDAVKVLDRIQVGIDGKHTPEGIAWARALNALSWAQPGYVQLDSPGVDISDYCMVMGIGEYPDTTAVTQFLANGGICIWAPKKPSDIAAVAGLLEVKADTTFIKPVVLENGVDLTVAAHGEQLLRFFEEGHDLGLNGSTFTAYFKLPGEFVAKLQPLLTYPDGTPGFAKVPALGNCYLWNIPLGAGNTNWPSTVGFLPFIGELVQLSREKRSGHFQGISIEPGERGKFFLEGFPSVQLIGPDNREIPLLMSADTTEQTAISPELTKCGMYEWRPASGPSQFLTVNFPAVESDLRTINPLLDQKAGVVFSGRGKDIRELHEGVELYKYLVGLLLAVYLGIVTLERWGENRT